jgi:hypothetical protein
MMATVVGSREDLALRLFSRGEAFDADGFSALFTDKPLYQFGNQPAAMSREAITDSVRRFFSLVSALYHDIRSVTAVGDTLFVEMDVHYWRVQDESHVVLPVFDIFRLDGEQVVELRIFMDAAPLLDRSLPVDADTSVYSLPSRQRMPSAQLMRRYFSRTDDGQQRIAKGFAPRWVGAGPRWGVGG